MSSSAAGPSSGGSGAPARPWIFDGHTHVFPQRLAMKIRNFFETHIAAARAAGEVSDDPCCFPSQQELWDNDFTSEADLPPHGSLVYPYHPWDPAQLVPAMCGAGVGGCWVLPYAHKRGMATKLNADIVVVCQSLKDAGLGRPEPGFTVHPDDGPEKVRQDVVDALLGGAKVAKLHASVGAYSVAHPNFDPFWQLAELTRFPTVVHAGKSVSGHSLKKDLADLWTVSERFPKARIIVAHSGSPAVKGALELALARDNVYLDTTPAVSRIPAYPANSTPAHSQLLTLARSGRVLFGSDVPNVAMRLETQLPDVCHVFGSPEDRKHLDAGGSVDGLRIWERRDGDALREVFGRAAERLMDEIRLDGLEKHGKQAARM